MHTSHASISVKCDASIEAECVCVCVSGAVKRIISHMVMAVADLVCPTSRTYQSMEA